MGINAQNPPLQSYPPLPEQENIGDIGDLIDRLIIPQLWLIVCRSWND